MSDTNPNRPLFTPGRQTEQRVGRARPSAERSFHLLRRSRDLREREGQAPGGGKSLMGPMSGAKNSGERLPL